MNGPHKLFDLKRQDTGWKSDPSIQGIPQLRAEQLIRPTPFQLVESATIFRELVVSRAVRLYVPSQRRSLRAVPLNMPAGGAEVISRGLFVPSIDGYLDLAPGTWFVNTPIVTAEGTQVEAVYHDAAFAVNQDQTLNAIAASAIAPAVVAVNGNTQLKAANVDDRIIVLSNPTGGVDVWLAFGGQVPVVGRGILLGPGSQPLVIGSDPNDGSLPQLEIRGFDDGGPQSVGVQVFR